LTSVDLGEGVQTIDEYAFYGCSGLKEIILPATITKVSNYSFQGCSALEKITLLALDVPTISNNAFSGCSRLTSVSFPMVTTIGSSAFFYCRYLSIIYLMGISVCTLSNSNAFSNTGIWSDKGSIFVPSSLVASYKAANHWSYFSNRIFAGDGGGDTGNLITFTVDGTSYQAEDGMTWGEWIDSDYNPGGFTVYNNDIVRGVMVVVNQGYNKVTTSDSIIANYSYLTD
jgi:hypothetical protein